MQRTMLFTLIGALLLFPFAGHGAEQEKIEERLKPFVTSESQTQNPWERIPSGGQTDPGTIYERALANFAMPGQAGAQSALEALEGLSYAFSNEYREYATAHLLLYSGAFDEAALRFGMLVKHDAFHEDIARRKLMLPEKLQGYAHGRGMEAAGDLESAWSSYENLFVLDSADRYAALTARLAGETPATPSPAPVFPEPDSSADYEAAVNQLRQGRCEDAAEAFELLGDYRGSDALADYARALNARGLRMDDRCASYAEKIKGNYHLLALLCEWQLPSPIELCGEPGAQEDGGMRFADPRARRVIEAALGKAKGEPIDPEELPGIAQITLATGKITRVYKLDDFAKCVNLTHLELEGSRISRIDPIRHLTELRTLNLNENSIADISALRYLTNLETLSLSGNYISDLSPLDNLYSLKKLTIRSNRPLSKSEINRFKKANPGCSVSY